MQEHVLEASHGIEAAQTTAILIANPTSGSYIFHAQQIKDTITFLREHGWQAELRLTTAAGDAGRLARAAVEQQVNVVVAVGGDGTINEIIQELAGSETALAVLPSGTVNVWAREVGIPLDNNGARDVLLHGQTRYVDLGKVNDRYFLLMTGIGLDGEVTQFIEKKPAKRLGVIGYWLVGAWLGMGYGGFHITMHMNGRRIKTHALQVIIGNTQLYGGAIKYTWQAQCDDGLLDICIVRRQSMLRRPLVLLDFLFHREQRRQWVRYEKCTRVNIRTRHPVAIQIDGDPMGYTSQGYPPTSVTIVPGALKVLVPQKTPEGLFSHSAPDA
jgi:YegS/Rv2252/BmrU family lipid kinase